MRTGPVLPERIPRVTVVAGARPNFMKVAPVIRSLRGRAKVRFVHTGQHYDKALSDVFLDELNLPAPDANLGVGSGSHSSQTARVMLAFEEELARHRPDAVVVVGDVNSTLACALAAAQNGVPVAHVESGLRSFDRSMPEETNRLLTDRLSTWLLTPSEDADQNLLAEGYSKESIYRVGNTMIDTLLDNLSLAQEAARELVPKLGLPKEYGVVTLHRPSNVDSASRLSDLIDALVSVSKMLPLLLPLHPRTTAALRQFELILPSELYISEPLPYLAFTGLLADAKIVLTDSGGVQEETSALGVPCLTLRDTTERPITCRLGTNQLVGSQPKDLSNIVYSTLANPPRPHPIPLWDGGAGQRCAEAVLASLGVP